MASLKYELAVVPDLANLAPTTMNVRQPESGEVLVRVEASSLNFHDLLVVTGAIKTLPGRVPLSDGVGIVEACGPGAQRFAVGDRVMGTFFPAWVAGTPKADSVAAMRGDHVDGFAASYITMAETGFTRAPTNLDPIAAATLPCAGVTAWRALFVEGYVQPGETVLVQGSGGVSIFALQFARAAGARVIATSGSPDKADRLLALGAHAVVDRHDPEWGLAVRRHCGGGGVDHVIEVAGGDLSQSLQALRVGGRLCLVGVLSRKPIHIPPVHLIHANRRIAGITVGSREHQEAMVAAVELNNIVPVVDSVYALSNLSLAFKGFARQLHFGKIAIAFA